MYVFLKNVDSILFGAEINFIIIIIIIIKYVLGLGNNCAYVGIVGIEPMDPELHT